MTITITIALNELHIIIIWIVGLILTFNIAYACADYELPEMHVFSVIMLACWPIIWIIIFIATLIDPIIYHAKDHINIKFKRKI